MYKKFISIFICLTIITGLIPAGVFAAKTTDNIDVQFNITGQWQDGFNADMVLINNGDNMIENWKLNFDFPQEITNMWNAEIISVDNGSYCIKNAGWNRDIQPHSQVSFGFSGSWDNNALIPPSNYEVISDIKEENTENYDVDFQLMSDWGAGFSAQMIIHNRTEKDIEGWHLEFDFDKNIDSIWNAVTDRTENGRYYISNAGYNSVIPVGGEIIIGFNGSDGNVTEYPSNYVLYGSDGNGEPISVVTPTPHVDTSELQITVDADAFDAANEESDIYTISQYKESITGKLTKVDEIESFSYTVLNSKDEVKSEDNIEILENWSIQNFILDIGLNEFKLTAVTYNGDVVEKEITILNLCVENTDIDPYEWETDEDNDGLTNYFEDYIGTDKSNSDTDNDRLPDGYEFFSLDTDPLKIDTDENGITDADEDFDNDGLTNYEEYILDTNPNNNDSDNDGLTDSDEVRTYGTEPLNPDTDGDELTDSIDVKLGFDPTLPDTYGNGIVDSEEYVLQTYTYDIKSDEFPDVTQLVITARAQGLLDDKVTIRNMYDINIISTDMAEKLDCVIGTPLKIQLSDSVENAEVSFAYTEGISGIDNLGILMYDYDSNEYKIAASQNAANTISITDFTDGEYIVADLSKWSDSWNNYVFEKYHIVTDEEIRIAEENANRPATVQTAEQEIYCEELPAFTKVDVSFETSDIIECTTEIDNVYNVDMYSTNLVGLVGAPIDIHTDSKFTEATVTFTYDRDKLGDTKEENLGVLWYDVENHDFVKMDSVVDTENCTLSFKTTHFSTYMPYDKTIYDKLFEENSETDHGNDKWQGEVITPDDFLNMTRAHRFSTDLSDLTAMSDGNPLYITKIRSTYNMVNENESLIGEYYIASPYIMYKDTLTTLRYYPMLGALVSGNDNNGSLTMFPLSHRGSYRINWTPQFPYYSAINEDDPGTVEILEKYYIPAYYFDHTDTDSDGLLDVNESIGLRLTNGVQIFTDFENADSDNDGMLDGEEVFRCDVKDGFFYMQSDPNSVDSDGDGYGDDIDPDPLVKTDFDKSVEITDRFYNPVERRCEITAFVSAYSVDNWENAEMILEFDDPDLVTSVEEGIDMRSSYMYKKWDFNLEKGVVFDQVGYNLTLKIKGETVYTTHRYISEGEYIRPQITEANGPLQDGKYAFSVKISGDTSKTASIVIKDTDGNVVMTDSKSDINMSLGCTFCTFLEASKEYMMEIVVNKGMTDEYTYNSVITFNDKEDMNTDTDGDGLCDYTARIVKGKIAAPKDPEPFIRNAPKGLWDAHVIQLMYGDNPNELKEDFRKDVSEYFESISSSDDIDYKIAAQIVSQVLKLRKSASENEEDIRKLLLGVKSITKKDLRTITGAFVLNFIYDIDGIAYHSQNNTWQRRFGYNVFYDEVFDIGTFMNANDIKFSVNGIEHVLWLWKGDYWNLGGGAEIGLYKYSNIYDYKDDYKEEDKVKDKEKGEDKSKYFVTPHYNAIDFELPMTLSLYNYNSASSIVNIFSWRPNDDQWWITGFNPDTIYTDPYNMISIGTIDFSSNKEMFNALYKVRNNKKAENYLIFDNDEKKLWIMWYEGVAL